MKRGGIDIASERERLNACLGKREHVQAANRLRRRQIAHGQAQRMGRSNLVIAIGDDHHRPKRLQPAAEKQEEIERRPPSAYLRLR